jgi:hypothetical protein
MREEKGDAQAGEMSEAIGATKPPFKCPILATHDKYEEAHYFLEQMMREYHHPDHFRYNLNGFLQALRSVTFMIQNELKSVAGFDEWYETQQELMRKDPLLLRFLEGRNIIVHRGMLKQRSNVELGLFRWRKLKLAIVQEFDVDVSSHDLLDLVTTYPPIPFDPEHPWVGEQMGVRRTWRADELGDGEVIGLCDSAWSRIGKVVTAAHLLAGARYEGPPEDTHDVSQVNVLLETDLNPELIKKWGWEPSEKPAPDSGDEEPSSGGR